MSIDHTDAVIQLNQTQRLLAYFQQRGVGNPVTNRELNELCFRYAARIHELRQEGYVITTEPVKGRVGLYRFTYYGRPP